MSRTIVVTGASGFIGRHVSAYLRSKASTVVAIMRPDSRRRPPPDVDVRKAPLTADRLLPHFQQADGVVHLAGVTRATVERHYQRVNVDGTREVALAARRAGIQLVHVSSQAAAGPGTVATPRRDTDPDAPLTAYGRSKLAGEGAVRTTAGLDWTILRPAAVYGPGDRAFLPLFRLAHRGWFLQTRNAAAAYSLVHVEDVVRGIDTVLGEPVARHETYFLAAPQPETAETVGRTLAAAVGRPYRPMTIPDSLLQALAAMGTAAGRAGMRVPLDGSRLAELRAEGFVCSVDKAARDLGFCAAITLRPGFVSTAAWYLEHGWI